VRSIGSGYSISIPDSRFPIPGSRLLIADCDSQLPNPDSRLVSHRGPSPALNGLRRL